MATDPKITIRVPNAAGLELIRQAEGKRLRAYVCPAGKWTIGYGHTAGVGPGDVITEAEAERLLLEDALVASAGVCRLVSVPLTGNQHAALVSFVFNLGEGRLAGSTLRRMLNAGDYAAVPAQLKQWVKGKDPKTGQLVKLGGLIDRREKEARLWQLPDESPGAP